MIINLKQTFLVIITLAAGFSTSVVVKNQSAPEMCLTRGCVRAASAILKNMDPSMDPCDDFYQFACGGFLKQTNVAADQSYVTTYSLIRDQLQGKLKAIITKKRKSNEPKPFLLVKQLYKTCMNKTGVERKGLGTLQTILKDLGGWPVLEGLNWNKGDLDWKEAVYKLRKWGLGGHYVLKVKIDTDAKNSSQRVITLDQADLGLNQKYLIKGATHNVVKAYYDYMVEVVGILGSTTNSSSQELRDSLDFEINLAKISLSQEERRNATKLYHPMSIKDLQLKHPSIPWNQYINQVINLSDDSIGEDEIMIVKVPQYLHKLEELLKNTTVRVQLNYLLWRAVKASIPYLTQKLGTKKLKFDEVLRGVTERKHRSKECVDVVANRMDFAIGALYARRYFTQEARNNVMVIMTDIRNEFRKILQEIDWIDEQTRKSALEKAATMSTYVGYSDELYDNTELEKYYSGLTLDPNDYLLSVLNVSLFTREKQFAKFRQPVNKTDWTTRVSPALVNAFYDPTENSIQFPAGILQGAYFDNNRPSYLNYGAIGFVIGHEITHGFDDEGSQYDKEGNLVDWWAPQTKKAFITKAQCMIDQYNGYSIPQLNLTLNGVNTQGENIADNGGVKEAYLAYKTRTQREGPEPQLPGLNYTASQLFWISTANPYCSKWKPESLKLTVLTDPHSPEEFRIRVPFSNLDYFANDFNCPLGSKMNPKHKCQVW